MKQRQRAGAIVREADHELCPVECAAPELILALSCYLDESSSRESLSISTCETA
jgi:hypothetical protein